jgi:hypothetical protein
MVCDMLERGEEGLHCSRGARCWGRGMCGGGRERGQGYWESGYVARRANQLRSARIRRKWGDRSTVGAADGSPEEVRKEGGLQIVYLPPGHTMTPVSNPDPAREIQTNSQGLIDAHGHPLLYGYYSQLPLTGSKSVQEVITRVEEFVSANYSSLPAGAWVEGMGWDQNIWNVKEYPTAVSYAAKYWRDHQEADGIRQTWMHHLF